MPKRRSWALAAAVAMLLAGCSATGTTVLAAKGGASESPAPSTSPSAVPGSTAPAPAPSCTARQLTVSYGDYGYSPGPLKHVAELRLTNTGAATCQLYGWPTLGITRNGVNVAGPIYRVPPAGVSNPDHPSANPPDQPPTTGTTPHVISLPPGADALVLLVVGDYTNSYAACAGMRHSDTSVTLGLPAGGGMLVVTGLEVPQCPGNVVSESPFMHDQHKLPPSTFSTPPQSATPGPNGAASPTGGVS